MSGGRPRKLDYDAALQLRDEGLSYPEIGRRLGVHHTTALYACDEAFRRQHCKDGRARAKEKRRS